MKKILIKISLLLSIPAYSQYTLEYEQLKTDGKGAFETNDFSRAVRHLEEAIILNPNDAEAFYFLGYSYSRLNANGAHKMIEAKRGLTIKASEAFEKVIKLTPRYEGETIALDPYTKITADWGSLAVAYWMKDQMDSVRWAFVEGKKRGGYGDFLLAIYRQALDQCKENGILFSSGDAISFPILYLQFVEKRRTDVTVIDIGINHTKWFPEFLCDQKRVKFNVSCSDLVDIKQRSITIHRIQAGDFKWKLKTKAELGFLTRGDLILHNILDANNFKRNIYFTSGFNPNDQLDLSVYFVSRNIIDEVDTARKRPLAQIEYKKILTSLLLTFKKVNKNSPDELRFVDMIRINSIFRIMKNDPGNHIEEGLEIIELIEKYASADEYPYSGGAESRMAKYVTEVKKYLESMNED